MSKLLEKYGKKMREQGRLEGKREVDIEIATRMLADGKLTLEEIAEYTKLEIVEIQELAARLR